MPIVMLCPGCEKVLKAPDGAEGRKAQCHKCGMRMLVPGEPPVILEMENDDADDFEVVQESHEEFETTPDDRRPAIRARERFDQDEVSPRPRPRKPKRRKRAAPMSKAPIFIGLALAFLAILGLGIYFLIRSLSDGGGTVREWVKFDAPDGAYAAHFPDGAPTAGGFEAIIGGSRISESEKTALNSAISSLQPKSWSREIGRRSYFVITLDIPPSLKGEMSEEEILKPTGPTSTFGNATSQILSDSVIDFAGHKTKQIVSYNAKENLTAVSRTFLAGQRMVIVGVSGKKGLKADDPLVSQFFAKFEWKGPAPRANVSP